MTPDEISAPPREPQNAHHWQCDWHADEIPAECNCGLTGPRAWWMDLVPADRAPTDREARLLNAARDLKLKPEAIATAKITVKPRSVRFAWDNGFSVTVSVP